MTSTNSELKQSVATEGSSARATHFESRPTIEVLSQLVVIILPALALIAVVMGVQDSPYRITMLVSFLSMYALVGLGVTIGFHRLLTHRSFETYAIVRYAFAIMGTMSAQGYFFNWIAEHRVHHMYSDHELDPHSPHLHGHGLWNRIRGFTHAHLGWLVAPRLLGMHKYIPELRADPLMIWIDRLSLFWIALGIAGPAVITYALTRDHKAAGIAALWGGLIRIFFLNHTTWSINSICHNWGSKPFASNDESRNNWIFGILAFGEGWHNNHHAFPRSARHGLFKYQIDMSYEIIKFMEKIGLAWNVKIPDEASISKKIASEKARQLSR